MVNAATAKRTVNPVAMSMILWGSERGMLQDLDGYKLNLKCEKPWADLPRVLLVFAIECLPRRCSIPRQNRRAAGNSARALIGRLYFGLLRDDTRQVQASTAPVAASVSTS